MSKKCRDHLGNEYKSISEMCLHYNIDVHTYMSRVKNGMTVEQSLTTPTRVDGRRKKCKDHLGNEFNSVTEMCMHYKLSVMTFRIRINRGWSLEDALTVPVDRDKKSVKYTDKDGNKFRNKKEIASFHNMSCSRYYLLAKSGNTLEDDKDHKFGVGNCNLVTDPFGKTHRTLIKMLKFYDIPKSSYIAYILTGRSMTDVLVDKMNGRLLKVNSGSRYDNVVDHLGKHYESISDMCRHYNIKYSSLKNRLLIGWSLKDSLTVPIKPDRCLKAKEIEDHLGNKYNSITSMCKHYGISCHTYKDRMIAGWSLEKALTIPVKPRKKYNRE